MAMGFRIVGPVEEAHVSTAQPKTLLSSEKDDKLQRLCTAQRCTPRTVIPANKIPILNIFGCIGTCAVMC